MKVCTHEDHFAAIVLLAQRFDSFKRLDHLGHAKTNETNPREVMLRVPSVGGGDRVGPGTPKPRVARLSYYARMGRPNVFAI